jgi:hypothetical protein
MMTNSATRKVLINQPNKKGLNTLKLCELPIIFKKALQANKCDAWIHQTIIL